MLKLIFEIFVVFFGVCGEILIDEVVSVIVFVCVVGFFFWFDGFGFAFAFAARVVSVFAFSFGGVLKYFWCIFVGF